MGESFPLWAKAFAVAETIGFPNEPTKNTGIAFYAL
jgi:hypothetical protein